MEEKITIQKKLPKKLSKYRYSGYRAGDFDLTESPIKEIARVKNLLQEGRVKLSTVYLIQCNDKYKIGFSDCPIKRLIALQIGNPYELDLLWEDEVPNFMQIEEGLHKKFASKRTIGEWFNLDKEDVDYILSLK